MDKCLDDKEKYKTFYYCEKPFKYPNGQCSLEVTLKKDTEFPEMLETKKRIDIISPLFSYVRIIVFTKSHLFNLFLRKTTHS
jgi:hypothetical protein